MIKSMRQSTLETLGLGNVLSIFENGKLPVQTEELVDKVFGSAGNRGAMVISGANGIVGAGKLMQFGVRLKQYGVPIVALDFAAAPDGIGAQYKGLAASFGKKEADEIMSNVIRLNYDGKTLPSYLKALNPRFLLEAIPEILEIKKAHYDVFRNNFPGIEIRSVTSGFPSSELGVGIAHPAFPHQINKVWEIVEDEPSDITKLQWSLGMIPMQVSDNWAFVLDVMFCGLTLAGTRYNEATNVPFWKIDKFIRKFWGPNPFRAHDAIGAKGANFLTWSCLHHLGKYYGDVFTPTETLTEHKDTGGNWYPLNHLRPIINYSLEDEDIDMFNALILGPLFQMTSLMLHEKRAHLSALNAIGELCAQFRSGILSVIRSYGAEKAVKIVNDYHKLEPITAKSAWFPETFEMIESPEWQQLYVNAEHNGKVGVITLGRESYNEDIDKELNRAINWLKSKKIDNVILTGDFHLTTQLVGADTNDFFPALNDYNEGFRISNQWSKTARRFNDEFAVSVAFINGKRCLGGMLELLLHCHYVVSVDDAVLGSPEVNLPVIPGMEMCHWPFRKTTPDNWQKILFMLLEGKSVKAASAQGWLIDYAGKMDDVLKMTWNLAKNNTSSIQKRELNKEALKDIPRDIAGLTDTENQSVIAARQAILQTVTDSCGTTLSEALNIQSNHSTGFMTGKFCKAGFVGTEYNKTILV